MDLSPYLKARYNELAAMRELCEAAFNRNIAKAEAEAPE
jgi:hypothetical protein